MLTHISFLVYRHEAPKRLRCARASNYGRVSPKWINIKTWSDSKTLRDSTNRSLSTS